MSVERYARRRRVREQLVDRLRRASTDGALHCPACQQRLDKNDELGLRNGERFPCPHCDRDLASLAYEQAAYDESHWRPVLGALRGLEPEARCAGCAYLGAVAAACRRASTTLPGGLSAADHDLVCRLLDRSSWVTPDCDWSTSCHAVEQYRTWAAEGVALL